MCVNVCAHTQSQTTLLSVYFLNIGFIRVPKRLSFSNSPVESPRNSHGCGNFQLTDGKSLLMVESGGGEHVSFYMLKIHKNKDKQGMEDKTTLAIRVKY